MKVIGKQRASALA